MDDGFNSVTDSGGSVLTGSSVGTSESNFGKYAPYATSNSTRYEFTSNSADPVLLTIITPNFVCSRCNLYYSLTNEIMNIRCLYCKSQVENIITFKTIKAPDKTLFICQECREITNFDLNQSNVPIICKCGWRVFKEYKDKK